MSLKVGTLSVKRPRQYAKAPSGLTRPVVFSAQPRDFTDYDTVAQAGSILERAGRVLTSRAVYWEDPAVTPAQVTAREYAHECQRLNRTPAGRRATELLFSLLTDYQRETARRYGYFDVVVFDRTSADRLLEMEQPVLYNTIRCRITRAFPNGNILLGFLGRKEFAYQVCLHPVTPYPIDDICLAQLVAILKDPDEFVRLGNATTVTDARTPYEFDRMFSPIKIRTPRDLVLPHGAR